MRNMEKCPDNAALKKFVDYELAEEMNKKILTHLSSCDICREKAGCLLSEEQGLLKSLLSSHGGRRQKTEAPGRCLSKAAILAYAGKCLKEDQLKPVETHLQKCDNCMFELIEVQRMMNSSADLALDMSVLQAGPGIGADLLEIVLKTKDEIIELIRHTGELLSLTPQLGAVRGKEESGERLINIRKDFPEKDLSLEMRIGKEVEESGATVGVSIMRLSSEEFLSGMEVELSGQEMQQKRFTVDGFAEFHGIKTGAYGIKVRGELTVRITIE
jgi:hypothetical protein